MQDRGKQLTNDDDDSLSSLFHCSHSLLQSTSSLTEHGLYRSSILFFYSPISYKCFFKNNNANHFTRFDLFNLFNRWWNSRIRIRRRSRYSSHDDWIPYLVLLFIRLHLFQSW